MHSKKEHLGDIEFSQRYLIKYGAEQSVLCRGISFTQCPSSKV